MSDYVQHLGCSSVYAASGNRYTMPDAMLARLIRSTGGVGTVGRIRRSRRIRQSAHHA